MKLIKLPVRIVKDVEAPDMLDRLGITYEIEDNDLVSMDMYFNTESIICVYAEPNKEDSCIIDFVEYSREIALPIARVIETLRYA